MLPDPQKRCSECGCFGAVEFEHVDLCVNCYTEKGACCANEDNFPVCRITATAAPHSELGEPRQNQSVVS